MTSIFLDTNIPIYAGGAPHLYKLPCIGVLRLVYSRPRAFMTDVEVLQEILHRYLAINRWPIGTQVFNDFALLMRGRIESIHANDIEAAAASADKWPGLDARDLLHVAVMDRVGCTAIVSADRKFSLVPHIRRLDPADLPSWSNLVEM